MNRLAWFAVAGALAWVFASSRPTDAGRGFDRELAARVPALHNGRVKPLDTIARSSLLVFSGKQSLREGPRSIGPMEWLLELMLKPEEADQRKVFLVDHPEVWGLLGREQERERRLSYAGLAPKTQEIAAAAERAARLESAARTPFEAAVFRLHEDLVAYQRLKNSLQVWGADDFQLEVAAFESSLASGVEAVRAHQSSKPFDRRALQALAEFVRRYRFLSEAAAFRPLPPAAGEPVDGWKNVGEGLLEAVSSGRVREGVERLAAAATAYRRDDAAGFNRAMGEHAAWLARVSPSAAARARWETMFNRAEPFYKGMLLYLAAFLLAAASWLPTAGAARRLAPDLASLARGAAFAALVAAVSVHTLGLAARIALQGRPPVTNLYSSAVFVGWVAAWLGLAVEGFHRRAIGTAAAAAVGFATLLIAHHLSAAGDTMEMLRAVLDSNFWLATHVVAITIGYASTFLAGGLAHVWVLRAAARRGPEGTLLKPLEDSVYGIACFSLLFSFVGTVLGGIWADQSWGRFWGWDPKENGALLIVLWNAMILHARWGGFVRARGTMVMAVFGNVLTAVSWFGVNMLGIGLHSYGWMDKAFWWLAAFAAAELAFMAFAALGVPPRSPAARAQPAFAHSSKPD